MQLPIDPCFGGCACSAIVFVSCWRSSSWPTAWSSRAAQNSRLREPDRERRRCRPSRSSRRSASRTSSGPGPARPPAGLHPCADLRARARIPQELEARHRQPGEGRRCARRDRHARISISSCVQARADLNVAQANARLAEITAKRWQRSGRHRCGRQTGRRPAHLHLERQHRPGQGGAGERRPAGRRGRIQAPGRALRRHRHGARDRHRRADQRRARAAARSCSSSRRPASCASTSACRRTTCRACRQERAPRSRVPEHPGKIYAARSRPRRRPSTPSTGTTLMQIIVDNARRRDDAGRLCGHPPARSLPTAVLLSVPSSALIFDAKGLSVATVDADRPRAWSSRSPSRAISAPWSRSPPASAG